MKKLFIPQKLNRKQLCTLALLVAVTVVLSVFCTIRVGNAIKIPLKFISVFLAAALFGPWYGGLVCAMGDILNAILVPVGPPIPLLTVLEFVSGFLFGLFFYANNEKNYILRALICTLLLFLMDMFLTTAVLTSVGYFPNFKTAFITRIVAGIIKWVLQFSVLVIFKKHLTALRKVLQK